MNIEITPPVPQGAALLGCTYQSEQATGSIVGYERYHGMPRVCVACQPSNAHSWRWLPLPKGHTTTPINPLAGPSGGILTQPLSRAGRARPTYLID